MMEKTQVMETPGVFQGPYYPIVAELTLDDFCCSDFYQGHGHVFEPDSWLGCILFAASEVSLDGIAEAVDLADIEFAEDLDAETVDFIRRIPTEELVKLVDREALDYYQTLEKEYLEETANEDQDFISSEIYLYGYIHFYRAECEVDMNGLEKKLNAEGFLFISGDVNWAQYGGKFAKALDEESFHIIEIINNHEYFTDYPNEYTVTLCNVYLEDPSLATALRCCSYTPDNYTEITIEMKIDALYTYHGGDLVTSISGNNLEKMLEWIIKASYQYPWIESYTE